MKKNGAREEAVVTLNSILRQGSYGGLQLKKQLGEGELSRLDKALITEIVNGTMRNLIKIDWIIAQFTSNSKTKKIAPIIEDILRCGVYQILFLDRIPDSAVCNESAELARQFGHEGTVKFVNGVLRNISRSKEKLEYPDKNTKPLEYLSVFYSHPEWMVKKWLADYGYDFTEQLLLANNQVPDVTIRINSLKTDLTAVKESLEKENVKCYDGKYCKEALHIKGTSSIEDLTSYRRGLFQVQDESSMLCVLVLDPKPGDIVLDVCSAPGGKASYAAQLMKNDGQIIARDIHPHKLKLIDNNSKRMAIKIIKTQIMDAMEIDNEMSKKADCVLVDAPCSGLGLLRKKPDMRWKKNSEDFKQLVTMQKKILENAASCVKPKGVLVYSTCTINKMENIEVVRNFLENNNEFHMEDITQFLPDSIVNETAKEGYIEIYPHTHGIDGFFIARMRRK